MFNKDEDKDSALHFTLESGDRTTNMRFARTYFLNNLSQHYMKGYFFTDDEDERVLSKQGKINELNSRILFNAYYCLIQTFNKVKSGFLGGDLSLDDIVANGYAYQTFKKMFETRQGVQDITE